MHSSPFGPRAPVLLAVTAFVIGCGGEPDVGLLGTDETASAVATQLAFTVEPSNTSANASITPAVRVTARDDQGNTVTTFTGNITVAIGTNPSAGILAGTKTRKAVAGVATFNNLSIKKSGTGYTLVATAPNQTSATSSAFDITPGVAMRLGAFGVPPAVAGVAISPAVQVKALDSFDNVATSFTANVSMAIPNPNGAALLGTTTVAAVAGVATFTDLSITKAANYKLRATSGTWAAGTPTFTVSPAVGAKLIFFVHPSNAKAGEKFNPAVRVQALDQFDNVATGFTGDVTIAIGNNPGGGTLTGVHTRTAVGGMAQFSGTVGLSIDKVGVGYTLVATSSGLTGVTSNPFNITPAAPAQLAFTVQPTTTAPGATITPAVKVTARDAQGNTATGFNGPITVAIGTNPSGGTLAGTKTQNAVAGVATFANLSINAAGTGYTLQATSANKTPATSNAFDIASDGGATQLAFTAQPSTTPAGTTISPAVQVAAQNAQGATVTGFTGNVTVTIGTNPAGGTLSGTTTVAAVAGVATFSNLSVNNAGAGYTLQATSGALASGTSAPFTITSAGDFWTTEAPMPTARSSSGVAALNGLLYVVGGTSDLGIVGTVEAYDPGTDEWTTKAPLPTPRFGLAVVAVNGVLYAFGGRDGDTWLATMTAYDPASDSWTPRAAMPTPRFVMGATVSNGIIYAFGGVDGSIGDPTDGLVAYDPATDSWTPKAPMSGPRTELGGAAINGIVYAVGGNSGCCALSRVEAYDPGADTWTMRGSMPTVHSNLGVTTSNSILYAVGGFNGVHHAATLEAYDPVTDSWTTKAPMPTVRHSLGFATINGILYAVGGGNQVHFATLEAYHP